MSFADDIQARLRRWALGVLRFCKSLSQVSEARDIARQLRRSSTGASANYRASRRARSRDEWLAKLGVVVEELDESVNWLVTLRDAQIAEPPQELLTECRELRAILAKSCATARARKKQKVEEKKRSHGKQPGSQASK